MNGLKEAFSRENLLKNLNFFAPVSYTHLFAQQ